jgi:hypothetical protein
VKRKAKKLLGRSPRGRKGEK